MTYGWHIIHNLNLLSITMEQQANSNVSSNKFVTIMSLKSNQLQVKTINPQVNEIFERVHIFFNDIDHLTWKTIIKI
jgi:hypothetical protein